MRCFREFPLSSPSLLHIPNPPCFQKGALSGDMLVAACLRKTQLSVAEDALRASRSVEESLMDTLQRTIDGYEACVFFQPVALVFD